MKSIYWTSSLTVLTASCLPELQCSVFCNVLLMWKLMFERRTELCCDQQLSWNGNSLSISDCFRLSSVTHYLCETRVRGVSKGYPHVCDYLPMAESQPWGSMLPSPLSLKSHCLIITHCLSQMIITVSINIFN